MEDFRAPTGPLDANASRVWVGRLVTDKDKTPVVYDPTLPGVPTGQVYLFNVARGALVPYQREIVSRYLQEVDPEERKQVRKAISSAWKSARRDFIKGRSSRVIRNRDTRPAQEETEDEE